MYSAPSNTVLRNGVKTDTSFSWSHSMHSTQPYHYTSALPFFFFSAAVISWSQYTNFCDSIVIYVCMYACVNDECMYYCTVLTTSLYVAASSSTRSFCSPDAACVIIIVSIPVDVHVLTSWLAVIVWRGSSFDSTVDSSIIRARLEYQHGIVQYSYGGVCQYWWRHVAAQVEQAAVPVL